MTSPTSEASAAGDESEDDPPTVPVATGPADFIENLNNRASSINPAVDSVTTVIPAATVRVITVRRVTSDGEQETGGNLIMDAATSEFSETTYLYSFFYVLYTYEEPTF